MVVGGVVEGGLEDFLCTPRNHRYYHSYHHWNQESLFNIIPVWKKRVRERQRGRVKESDWEKELGLTMSLEDFVIAIWMWYSQRETEDKLYWLAIGFRGNASSLWSRSIHSAPPSGLRKDMKIIRCSYFWIASHFHRDSSELLFFFYVSNAMYSYVTRLDFEQPYWELFCT